MEEWFGIKGGLNCFTYGWLFKLFKAHAILQAHYRFCKSLQVTALCRINLRYSIPHQNVMYKFQNNGYTQAPVLKNFTHSSVFEKIFLLLRPAAVINTFLLHGQCYTLFCSHLSAPLVCLLNLC